MDFRLKSVLQYFALDDFDAGVHRLFSFFKTLSVESFAA
jgi:hypothetical protein